jgi:glutathione peroxidase
MLSLHILKTFVELSILTSLASTAPQNFHALSATDIDGKSVPMSRYKGKTLLIANTASGCGFTPQYKGLQALQDRYGAQGLVVLGFPSNDFGGQEPGTNAEVKKFCTLNYKVSFPLMSKGSVKGPGKQEIYRFLTQNSSTGGEVMWNFEKFLVSSKGQVVNRFRSNIDPLSQEIAKAIEGELNASSPSKASP